jgi:glycosyltransferase involved in cell wall biosynthesis
MRFSIIIPTWNNLPFLRLCVDSIRRHSSEEHQIIIHVNEGSDGTLEWVREQGFDYTWSERNVGVCIACNMMRAKVQTDYILYLNDDMYVLPGWDTALAAEVDALPDNRFFLSSTMIHPRKPENIGIVADYGDSLETFEEERLLREYAALPCADWRGATWPPNLLHRDIWDLVGGYSIEFSPGMGSDPDLTAKLWMIGVRHFKGLADSRVYHFETKSTERIRQNDARMQFMLKWGVANSVLRDQLTLLGQPWETPSSPSPITKGTRLRYRLKVIINLIKGKQIGPIEPLQ